VRSKIQDALLSALETILRPIVKLLLQSGTSYSEFVSVAKTVFVRVATDEYKKRGRPPNFSQVSAMTGISRKEVAKIRKRKPGMRWTPNMEASPVNTILQEWHFDPDFSDGAGTPKALALEGPLSFSALVAKFAGDIPPGAMRSTLQKAGILVQQADGRVSATQPYLFPREYGADLIRNIAFSLGNLGSTVAHNASVQQLQASSEKKRELARLQRGVWSEHLSEEGAKKFKQCVESAAQRFLAEANQFVGENELPRSQWSKTKPRAIGVSVFYYEED